MEEDDDKFVSYQVECQSGTRVETFNMHFMTPERAISYMHLCKKASPNRDFWVIKVTREFIADTYKESEIDTVTGPVTDFHEDWMMS